nr:phosphatidylinositide phosphatase SAC2-like [Loxodonta africana]
MEEQAPAPGLRGSFVIGKYNKCSIDLPWWLILIRQKAVVGKLPGDHEVCKITKIAVLSLSEMEPQDLELELCKKHHFGINKPEKIVPSPDDSKFLLKTFTHIKSNVSAPNKKKVRESKEKEKLERKLLEELLKMFVDSESFYYSLTYDLTNSVQRQSAGERDGCPLWQKVDDRFFWNKYMIQDLTEIGVPDVNFWIIPIIQGFVQIEELAVSYNEASDDEKSSPETPPQESTCVDDVYPRFLVALISRRSRHRAGMRYKRRGVDQNGNVANYVETEQLIHVHNHTLSFIQTRGSVPVFWSQVGYRYNPRPRLDKSEKETVAYFCAHFEEQLKIYKKQVIINLVDQAGREKIIGDAYLKQVLLFNNSHLTYVSFDFHEHCRGMKFENVHTLTDAIYDIILDMKWCWVDQAGVICKQEGIFRVNCMDCLDRTNVVQAAIARVVLEQQLKKLGVLPPEQPLPVKCSRIYQLMWANNGDSISRQYAGTAALKGDFTRTGERKLAGVMKDGVNSANRYYLNRFKDAYRQAVIDLMQGIPVTEDLYSIFTKEKEHEALHKESQRSHQELISQLLQSYMKLLLPDDEKFHGGWALIDCDPRYSCRRPEDWNLVVQRFRGPQPESSSALEALEAGVHLPALQRELSSTETSGAAGSSQLPWLLPSVMIRGPTCFSFPTRGTAHRAPLDSPSRALSCPFPSSSLPRPHLQPRHHRKIADFNHIRSLLAVRYGAERGNPKLERKSEVL